MATKMTAVEITERINKAEENLRKLYTLIQKRKAKLEKLNKKIESLKEGTYELKMVQMVQWDIESEQDALEENEKRIPEKQALVEKWKKKLDEAITETKRLNEIPEQLKKLQAELVEKIIASEIRYRERMYKDEAEMDHKEFIKKYSWREREYYMGRSQKDFREMVVKDANYEAKMWVLDLVNRVEKKVGQIISWKLWFASKALNGYVEGTKGSATIETIFAGGYNIQCLHQRVLVK